MGSGPCVDAKAAAQIALFRTCFGVAGVTKPLHASAVSTAFRKKGAFHSKPNASNRSSPLAYNVCARGTASALKMVCHTAKSNTSKHKYKEFGEKYASNRANAARTVLFTSFIMSNTQWYQVLAP